MRHKALVVLACLLSSGCASLALAENVEIGGLREAFKRCRTIVDPARRVGCYDALYTKLEQPTFKGSLAEETEPFKVEVPTMLRYQSDGAIFVMYLKDANGAVVQNLHIGGGGESTFLITKPGTYSLQISGSETWRVWVDPQTTALP